MANKIKKVVVTKEFVEDVKRHFSDDFGYRLARFWNRVTDIPNEIKWFFQRGMRGYADCDTWSLDYYISKWLPKALKDLSDRKIGHPGMIKDLKTWRKILKEMAAGFQADYDSEENYLSRKKELAAQKKLEKSLKLFSKYYKNLWD